MARWFVDRSAQRGIPSVSLRRLLPEATFGEVPDLVVTGCSADSRRLDPGQAFVALRGRRHDGHAFVGRALERGASAVIVERPCPDAGRLQVVVPDARLAHARICHALAGEPCEALPVFGIAGASGKTAAALYFRSILEAAGRRVGSVASCGWSDGTSQYPARPASPDAGELAEMLSRMVERRCEAAVLTLAASSLARRSVEALTLAGAVSTSVGRPGVDPASISEDRRSQARLFRRVAPGGLAVINADDPEADLLGAVNLGARRISFAVTAPADVTATIDGFDAEGSRIRIRGFDREVSVRLRPLGQASVAGALAAAAVAWGCELGPVAVAAGLEAVRSIPGRLEPVAAGPGPDCRIDRARTGPELAEALATLRGAGFGRILCVVAAGDDRGRHRALAEAAEAGADVVVATLDASASGDPHALLDDLLRRFRRPGRVLVEPDPGRSLARARMLAGPGDAVLVSGHGHPPLASRPRAATPHLRTVSGPSRPAFDRRSA